MKYAPSVFIAIITLTLADIAFDAFALWSITWSSTPKVVFYLILCIPYVLIVPGLSAIPTAKINMRLSTGEKETFESLSVLCFISVLWTIGSITHWIYVNWDAITRWIVWIAIITMIVKWRFYYLTKEAALALFRHQPSV